MSLPSILTAKTARAADAALTTFPVGMVDMSGSGAGPFLPVHLALDANGAPQVPALDATLQQLLTAFGTPAQPADIAAVVTKLEAVRALLAAALTVNLPAGAATDAKVEAVRALLAGTLKTAPQANAPAVDATGSLSAVNDAVTVLANGMNTGVIRLPTGFTGSIVAEGTADSTTYDVPLSVQFYASTGNTGGVGAITAGGVYEVTITGLAGFRVRAATTITGGPITALVRAANGNKSIRVGAPSGAPVPVQNPPGGVTQTIVTGTSGTLIAANPARKSLRWMVIGAADATVSPGTAAPTVGQGMVYQASGTGKQGASEAFMEGAMATNAFAYAASASTSIVVWECQ